MSKQSQPQHFQISSAICSRSGLRFRWVEEQIEGLDYSLFLHVHPLFLGENFLRIERQVKDEARYLTLSKELVAALILYRLTSWKVVQPSPSPSLLSSWLEGLAGEFSIVKLRDLYLSTLGNFSKEMQVHSPFHFNLESVTHIETKGEGGKDVVFTAPQQLANLINRCKEKQILSISQAETMEEARREKAGRLIEREIEQYRDSDKAARELASISEDYLIRRACSAMDAVYRDINWERATEGEEKKEKTWKKKWRAVRGEVEEDTMRVLSPDLQEKILLFLEWGIREAKLTGKPNKYLNMYIAWIRAEEAEGEDSWWIDGEEGKEGEEA